MMFGALNITLGSRATAGAARPRDKPVTAANPAPNCSKLRRVVDFVRGEALPPPACPLSLSPISPSLSGDPLLRANLPIYPSFLNRHALKFGGERMQPARAVVGDDDGFREYAAGFPAPPFRIEKVDVHGKHHAGAEFVANRRERRGVAALRVVAVAGIFERGEPVTVDAGLATSEHASCRTC